MKLIDKVKKAQKKREKELDKGYLKFDKIERKVLKKLKEFTTDIRRSRSDSAIKCFTTDIYVYWNNCKIFIRINYSINYGIDIKISSFDHTCKPVLTSLREFDSDFIELLKRVGAI